MTLEGWRDNGWLVEHETSKQEIANLLAVVDRDLHDAAIEALSGDWRLGIAYNAALQLATIALAASGFRPGRDRAHERTIQSLRHSVMLDQDLVDTLDGVRRKRNQVNYDRAGAASSGEAAEMHELAVELRGIVVAWLEQHHPKLLPPA